jgi:anaerobic magnesium-protoporphyrin IX monomethyl ester cyclase
LRVFLCQSYLGPPTAVAPVVFPLGLAYVASAIKDEHEVYCWDPNVAENPEKEFPELLEKVNPEVVGLSLRNIDSAVSSSTTWYYPRFVSMVRTIRQKAPHAKIVVGGPSFSLFAKEIMKRNPEIDFGVILDGEEPFARLLKDFTHPERVNNVIFRKEKLICFSETKAFDFKFRKPARELFNLKKYKQKKFSMNVLSKRGCAFKCTFCPNAFLAGYNYRFRSPELVAEEVEELRNNYGIDSFRFADATFNCPLDYASNICKELKKRKVDIEWTADFHTAYINESFMRDAVESNCKWFTFSPDGASNETLSMLKKGITVEDIKRTISLAKKIDGARVCYGFLYNLPSLNSNQIWGLAKLIPKMEHELGRKLLGIYMTKIRIFPYSEIYDLAIKESQIGKETDLIYPRYYSKTPALSRANIGAMALRIYLFTRFNLKVKTP